MSTASAPAHAHGLDALRAAAALAVLGLHGVSVGGWTDYPEHGPLAWLRVGFLGVDVFFVLSGYVITQSALALMQSAGPDWRRAFLWRRAARLYPLYLLTSLLFLACVQAAALQGEDALWQVLSHLLLVHNLLPSTAGSINGVSWSIGTEAQCYLLTLLLLPWLRQRPAWRIALAALLLAWVWRAGGWWLLAWLQPGASDALHSHLATQAPGFVDAYGLGTALALLPGGFAASRGARGLCLLAGLLLMALSAELYLRYVHSGDYWRSPASAALLRSLPALAAALLVLGLRHWRASARAPWVLLGVWSYGLYLWHLPVLLWLQAHTPWRAGTLLAATLALTVVLSALSWYALERPAIRWARRRAMAAASESPPAAPA